MPQCLQTGRAMFDQRHLLVRHFQYLAHKLSFGAKRHMHVDLLQLAGTENLPAPYEISMCRGP
jgi:hypothetical protein